MELVSILVPCYNHEKYIHDCLESLYNQSYKDIELLIIDDCSTDKSFERICDWGAKLEKRFVSVNIQKNKENLGIAKSLNIMLKFAKGDYIKILASDDMLTPWAIETFVKEAGKEDADIYFSNVALVPENASYTLIQPEYLSKIYLERPDDGKEITGKLCGNNYIAAPGVLIYRGTLEKYGLFDEQYIMEDYEYWLRVSVKGKFKYIDTISAYYRQNINSMSRFDLSKESIRRHRRFYEDKMLIFRKYETFVNILQKTTFFNSELDSAIGINDKELVNEICQMMKNEKIKMDQRNRLRIPLIKIGIYPVLKYLKHRIK